MRMCTVSSPCTCMYHTHKLAVLTLSFSLSLWHTYTHTFSSFWSLLLSLSHIFSASLSLTHTYTRTHLLHLSSNFAIADPEEIRHELWMATARFASSLFFFSAMLPPCNWLLRWIMCNMYGAYVMRTLFIVFLRCFYLATYLLRWTMCNISYILHT